MNTKKCRNKVILPLFRFPEFRDKAEWILKSCGDIFGQISNKNNNSNLPILAITQERGAVPRQIINYHVSVSKKSIENYKVVEIGDFIISLRSFQGGIEYSKYKGVCSPAYVVLRNKTKISNCFLKYFFKTERFIRDMTKNIEGLRDGKMVSYKQFSELALPFPPSEKEQQKIVDCLVSIDNLIQLETEKLYALKKHKKGLMQILFPVAGTDLPAYRFAEFLDAPAWEEKPLGKVFSRITTRNAENNLNCLTISAQDGLVSQFDYFNKKISSKDLTGYYLLNKGDFVYNKSYSKDYPMGAIKRLNCYDKGVVSTLYICFKVHKEYSEDFFEYFFDHGMINSDIAKVAQEGARNHGLLNVGVNDFFDKINVKYPQFKEQQKIAHCLASVDSIITAQHEKVEALKIYKNGLLQQLFPADTEYAK